VFRGKKYRHHRRLVLDALCLGTYQRPEESVASICRLKRFYLKSPMISSFTRRSYSDTTIFYVVISCSSEGYIASIFKCETTKKLKKATR
jgi:hypothetical protein